MSAGKILGPKGLQLADLPANPTVCLSQFLHINWTGPNLKAGMPFWQAKG
jgi:hypothetical protein